MLTTTLTSLITLKFTLIEKIKRLNSIPSKGLSPEQIEYLRNKHYTDFGYYPDSSFDARMQRIYDLINAGGYYGLPDPKFSVHNFYCSILTKVLEIREETRWIRRRVAEGEKLTQYEIDDLMAKSQRMWDLAHSVPDAYLNSPEFIHALDTGQLKFPGHTPTAVFDYIQNALAEINTTHAADLASRVYEPDSLFWSWVAFPEYIILFFIIFLLFTNVQKNRHFLTMIFWMFFALSLNCGMRAAFYPAPNHFLIDSFYLCDIYSSYVKGIFYFLMTLYLLMVDHKITDDASSFVKIHFISLLFLAFFTTAVISSFDLFFFYIAIEGMSFSTIVLLVFSGKPKTTVRAAIKYFCLNAFASGCLLFSIALLYGFCNNTSFTSFVDVTHDFVLMPNSFIALVVFFFVFVGFKLALFPLGAWLPSVYGQLDYSMIYLFGLVIKTILFLVFFRLIVFSFPPMFEYFSNLFLGFGLVSLIIGSIAAFAQQDLRRFLAYTSIAHMGSIMISLHIMDDLGFFAAMQYLAIYVISSSVVFYCLSTTYYAKDNKLVPIVFHSISELRYLKSVSPKAAIALTISFLSMAGAAPLAGFWAKFSICLVLMSEGLELLTILFILFSIISIAYYLQIIQSIWFDSKNPTDTRLEVISILDVNSKNSTDLANFYIFGFILSLVAYYFYYESAVYYIYEVIDSARCVFSVSLEYPVKKTLFVEWERYLMFQLDKLGAYIRSWSK